MKSTTKWLSRIFDFDIFNQNFAKMDFFRKNANKIQNFGRIQKTGIYVMYLLIVLQCAKFQADISILDPQIVQITVKTDDVIFSNAIFGRSIHRTSK